MKRMLPLALFPLLALILALTACSGGGDGGSGGGGSSSNASQKGVISGNVSVSSSLTSGQSLSVTIAADSTTAVASTKSDDYYASEPSSDQTAPTEQLPPTLTVPVDADGNFTAQVPAGTSYSTAVHLSSTLSQKSGVVSRAPAASGLGSIISDIAVEPGKKIVLTVDDSHLQQPGTLTLRVADAFTSAAVAGTTATLIRTGESAVTAADGTLTFSGVVPGTHTLLLEGAGYADVTRDFTLTPGQALDLGTINLNSQSGTVVGQVSATGFDSLAGIVVYLRGIDGSIYSVFTNTSGLYRFERIPAAGGYSVLASANGLRSEKVDNIEVATGVTSSVATLHLGAIDDDDTGAITGFARFAERADFAHAGIIVSIEGSDLEAITARDGSFILNNVPAGTYTLNYTDSNHQTVTREGVRVVATAATKLAPVVLASVNGGLSGEVRAQGGGALPGAILTISDTGERTVADGAGKFTFTTLQVGSHTLEASLPGYTTTTVPVTIAGNVTTPIATPIELVPHHFSGRVLLGTDVTDRSGVSVTLTGGASYAAVTSADGAFSFAAVPPGNYQLTVAMSGYKTQNLAVYIPAEESDYVLPYDIQMTLNYGTLSGVARLQNAEDHSGTVVTVAGTAYTTQTDINGAWVMSLPEGSYGGGVQYAHAGFISRNDTAALAIVGEQSTVLATATLDREVGTISGLIQDDGGTPLGGVTVSEPFSGASTTTGANGGFTLANVPVGTRTVTASLAGHVRGSVEVAVTSGVTSAIASPLILVPYQFQGTVSLGKEITDHSGVELVLEGTASKTTFSAADGSFSFSAVPAGNYRLTMSKAGYVTEAINLVLPDMAVYTLPYQVTLVKAEAQMRGVVELSGRNDHSGVIITVIDASAVNHQTVSNTLGQWLISLPTGVTYAEVRYSIADYQGQTTTNGGAGYTLSEGDSLDLGKVVLQPDIGTLSGHVVDGTGTAIAEAQVTMADATHTFTATTDASGNYSRSDVVTGTYSVAVFKAGYGTAQQAGVVVTQGATATANFTLQPNQIAGTVTLEGLASEGLVPDYGGIDVVLVDGTGTQQGATTTAVNGAFTLNKVVAGTYTLVVNQTFNASYEVSSIPLTLVGNDGYLFTSAIQVHKKPIVADRDLLTFDYIKGANSSATNVRYNLVLPGTMPNGSTVSWSSSNTTLISTQGVVTLPKSGDNTSVTLEATLTLDGINQTVSFNLTVPPLYQPKYSATTQTITLAEDFGYIFKGMAASNDNGEAISYTITDNTNSSLFESVSIDPQSGEVTLRSKDNQHGTATITIEASSGFPVLTATASLTVTVNPVADPVTAVANVQSPAKMPVEPGSTISLNGIVSDVDGDATSLWELTPPSDSMATLSNSDPLSVNFTPDVVGDYKVVLTVSNAGYSSQSEVWVFARPKLTVADQSVKEGSDVTFTLNLSHAYGEAITLNYATVDLTAEMYKDYQPRVGSLTFAPGEQSKVITVPVTVDQLPESTEQFVLVLSDMTNLTETSASATATIEYAPLDLFYLTGENGVAIDNTGSSDSSYGGTNRMIGDLNGDGFDDVAIGAPYANSFSGQVTVMFGGSSIGTMGHFDATTDGRLTIKAPSTYSYLGMAIAGAGDFNGDGIDDIVVSAPYDDLAGMNYGTVFVIYGQSGWPQDAVNTVDLATFASGSQGLRIAGETGNVYTGASVAGVGDVNGDGYDDILIGAYGYGSNKGRAYLVYGGAGYSSDLFLSALGSSGVVIDGGDGSGAAGRTVSSAGDMNGDGYMDFMIAAPYAASYSGRAYLIFGSPSLPSSMALPSADSVFSSGVVYKGASGTRFGYDIAAAGDMNGDGYADAVIGDLYGSSNKGQALVVYGGKSLMANTLVDTTTLSAEQALRIQGESVYSYTGSAVAGAGDVNGDGLDDVMVGANGVDGKAGAVYVVYGGATGTVNLAILDGSNGFSMRGVETGVQLGSSVDGGGDLNGDGYYDLLAGSGFGKNSYLVYGGKHNSRVTADLLSGQSYEGSTAPDRIVGDTGDETVVGNGGSDSISTGNGSDTITVSDLSFARVDGGHGGVTVFTAIPKDRLYIQGAGKTYDFTLMGPERIRNIEEIHFDGSGPNTVVLDTAAVRRLNNQAGGGVIYLDGGTDDKVELLDGAEWSFEPCDNSVRVCTVYTHSSGISFVTSSEMPTVPAIVVDDVTVNEDRGTVKVRLRRENGVYESDVWYQTIDGTAQAGVDYVGIPSTKMTFAVGELVKEVTVTLKDDVKFESAKSFSLELSSPVNAWISKGTSIITILDDTIDLSALKPAKGVTFSGEFYTTLTNSGITAAGDVNGDGYEDLIMYSAGGNSVVIFGGPDINSGGVDLTVSTGKLDGSNGFVIYTYYNGFSITGIGDINGDGYDDLAIGQSYALSKAGRTQIVFGGPTIGAGGRYDISVADPAKAISINGITANDMAGSVIARAGDVNRDGYDDLLIGAPSKSSSTGEAYLVYGHGGAWSDLELSALDGTNGVKMTGLAASDYFGSAITAAGDMNGDGYDDFAVGAKYDSGQYSYSGKVYLVLGGATPLGSGGVLSLSDARIVEFLGWGGAYAGTSVANIGDFNHDGFDDMLIGGPSASTASGIVGEAYVVYGASSLSDLYLADEDNPGDGVVKLNGTNGFVVRGGLDDTKQGMHLGVTVAHLGDMNADGYDDLLIGAPLYNSSTGYSYADARGKAFIVYGNGYTSSVMEIDSLNISSGFAISAEGVGERFAYSLGGGGDFNGDGFADLLLGAGNFSQLTVSGGRGYLIWGGDFLDKHYYEGDELDNNWQQYDEDYYYPKQGNDYLFVWNGPDYVFLGQGDDSVGVNGSYSTLDQMGKINGGRGWDCLQFAYGGSINLTTVANNFIKGMECINLHEIEYAGMAINNSLTLGVGDIMAMLDSDKHIFSINGDAGDAVTVTDGGWTYNGVVSATGLIPYTAGQYTTRDYKEWSLNGTPIKLRIDTDITTTTVPTGLVLPIVPILPILPVLP